MNTKKWKHGSFFHFISDMSKCFRHIKEFILPVFLISVLGSCAGTVPQPSPRHAEAAAKQWPGTTLQDLVRGRELYVSHCSSCHSLYSPTEYPAEHWRKIVPEMKVRAKIGEDEVLNIARYLITMSEADSISRRRKISDGS